MKIIFQGVYNKDQKVKDFVAYKFEMQAKFENYIVPISILFEFDPLLVYKVSIWTNKRSRYNILLLGKFSHEDADRAHRKELPEAIIAVFGVAIKIIALCDYQRRKTKNKSSIFINPFHPDGVAFEYVLHIQNQSDYKSLKTTLLK